jgi:hypothetical protein
MCISHMYIVCGCISYVVCGYCMCVLHFHIAGIAILYAYIVCICRISYVYILCVYCRRIYANPNLALTLSDRTYESNVYIVFVHCMCTLHVFIIWPVVCVYCMCIWYVYMTVLHAYSYGMHVLHAYIDHVVDANERKLVQVFCLLWARAIRVCDRLRGWMDECGLMGCFDIVKVGSIVSTTSDGRETEDLWGLRRPGVCCSISFTAFEKTVGWSQLMRKSDYSLSNRRVKYISKLYGSHAVHSFSIVTNVGSLCVQRFNRSNNYNGWWKGQAALLYLRWEKITALKIANALKFSWEHECDFWDSSLL